MSEEQLVNLLERAKHDDRAARRAPPQQRQAP